MSQASPPTLESGDGQKATSFRWVICGLLFFATTLNYTDRAVLGVLGSDLQKTIGWRDYEFGLINAAFSLAYGIGFFLMARVIEALGTRIAFMLAIIVWSFASAGHALAGTALGFGIARFCLGIGEAGNFPSAIKTVADWFPQRQRATATGIFNAGSNVGAIVAPFLVPVLVLAWGRYRYLSLHPETVATTTSPSVDQVFPLGWQAAFFITPALAVIWLILWWMFSKPPEENRFVNKAELAIIGERTSPPVAVKWRYLIAHRQAWSFMLGKFMTDPVWWFYLFWSGKFLADTFNVNIKTVGLPLIIIYFLADFGSIGGGMISSFLIKRGFSANVGRKIAMVVCACMVLPVIYAPITQNKWVAVVLLGIAASAHQGFSTNLFTLTSDMFPKKVVASVVSLGGFMGAIGGVLIAAIAGLVKEMTHSYLIMFIFAGTIYLLAVLVIHLTAPRLERVEESELESRRPPVWLLAIIWACVGFLAGIPLSYFFQQHSYEYATSFPRYLAAFFSGDLFTVSVPKGRADLSTEIMTDMRAHLAPMIIWVSLAGMGVMAATGAFGHSLLRREKLA